MSYVPISAYMATVLDDAAASNARTTLGLGTAATVNTPIPLASGGTTGTDAATARSGISAAFQPTGVTIVARSKATNYQPNTSGGTLVMCGVGASSSGDQSSVFIGSSNPASTNIIISSHGGLWHPLTFFVPKSWYYRITNDVGVGNLIANGTIGSVAEIYF